MPPIVGITGVIIDLDLDSSSMTLCLGGSEERTFELREDGSYAFDLEHLAEHRHDRAPVLVVVDKTNADLADDIHDAGMLPSLEDC